MDKSKWSWYTPPPTQYHIFFKTYPLLFHVACFSHGCWCLCFYRWVWSSNATMMLLACNLGQHFQDLSHTFSPIGSPGRKSNITHISFSSVGVRKRGIHYTCKLSDRLSASLWFPDLRRTLRCSTHNCSVVVSVKGTSRRHTYIFSEHQAKNLLIWLILVAHEDTTVHYKGEEGVIYR